MRTFTLRFLPAKLYHWLATTRFFNTQHHCLCLLFFAIAAFTAQAQDPPQYGTPFGGVPDTRDINMYQVHIRPFSAAGDLDGVTARLDQIKALGTSVIYLMPIFPHGTDSRSSASPYCIKDFKAVASEYGSLTDLRELVDGAHSRGMAVILDIAINGTSWDHPWITQHPEYYQREGGTIKQLANFGDIAALDLNHSGVRAAIKDAMRYWVFAANIDGYRCDFANNPPLDFWSDIIGDLRSINTHQLLMLAEGDRQENFTVGFDMNFGDRWFWNALKDVAGGGPVSTRFQTINDYEYLHATGSQQAVRYTGNHDTYTNDNGTQRPFEVFGSHDGIVANFLVSAYMKGVPFLMSGQEIDYEPRTDWPWTNFKFDWSQNPGAAADFAKILNFRTSSTAIRRGDLTIYPSDDISAFTKTSGNEKVAVMVNLRNTPKTFVIPSTMAGTYKDAYTGTTVTLTSGATQSLSAFQYLVLTNADVDPVAVTGVNVSPASINLNMGITQQITATVLPSNATNKQVTWTSSNNGVATVNGSGLVTAVAPGNATITAATQEGNFTANAVITVNPANNFTVHFYKPSSWGNNIRIYWWEAQPTGILADGSWPGISMTNEGNGWYSHTFTNITSTNLIFNDGSNQTANLSRGSAGWFQNGTWYNSNPGSCSPTAITPYLEVNGGGWNQTATATLDAGGSVSFGPQPLAGGSWSWNGPNGFTSSSREINLQNLQTNQSGDYVATFTNTGGCTSTQTFTLTVNAVTGSNLYRLKNRWQNAYLYDNGTQAAYGTPSASDQSSQWQLIDVDGYQAIKNVATGDYLNIENLQNHVECTDVPTSYYSAQWSLEDYDGYKRIRNRWQSGDYIHIENLFGYAQHGAVYAGAYSNHWQLEPVNTSSSSSTGSSFRKMTAYSDHSDQVLNIALFPNPFNTQFNLSIEGGAENAAYHVSIIDLSGKTFISKDYNVDATGRLDHWINAEFLQPGLYFVRIANQSHFEVHKIIKE